MPFTIIRQDITKMRVDAIVNAANTGLQMGSGVCGAIFRAAGPARLQAACNRLAPIRTGEAVITPGFALPAKYVIHAAGPVYRPEHPARSRELLRAAYLSSLTLAEEHGCESIAFPLISSGIYGYPKAEALQVATTAIREYLAGHDMNVYLAVFGRESLRVSEKLLGEVESYIDEHYVQAHQSGRRALLDAEKIDFFNAAENELRTPETAMLSKPPRPAAKAAPPAAGQSKAAPPAARQSKAAPPAAGQSKAAPPAAGQSLNDLIDHLDEPFSDTLLKLIDAKGKTDVEVYKRANIDRKLFSKIRTGKGYTPRKPTILALAVALELTLPETDDLLSRAGYALSHASKFDVIVEFFIVSGNYNIYEINEVLFKYDQPLLGA